MTSYHLSAPPHPGSLKEKYNRRRYSPYLKELSAVMGQMYLADKPKNKIGAFKGERR